MVHGTHIHKESFKSSAQTHVKACDKDLEAYEDMHKLPKAHEGMCVDSRSSCIIMKAHESLSKHW